MDIQKYKNQLDSNLTGGRALSDKNIIKKYLKILIKYFTILKIQYSDKEKDSIKNFNIENSNYFDHYGLISDIDIDKLKLFFQKIGKNSKNNINIMTKIVYKLTKEITKSFNKEACWLTIRVSLPNQHFDIARWHMDGRFFDFEKNTNQMKFITTLKGPETLLCDVDDKFRDICLKMREDFWKLQKSNENNDLNETNFRIKMEKIFSNQKIIKLKNNEGCLFTVGDLNKAI